MSRLIPDHEDILYEQFEHCIAEIEKFRCHMRAQRNPLADDIADSTHFLIASNICFVLDPFGDRFRLCLARVPDVYERIVTPQSKGGGIARTLAMLHGGSDTVPSLRYGGAKEAVLEYILRYPLVEEIQARNGACQVEVGSTAVEALLRGVEPSLAEKLSARIVPDESDFLFLRIERSEIDYTSFAVRHQEKRVLLVDIPEGQTVSFRSERRISLMESVTKQRFDLLGGRDILAVNVRDETTAERLLEQARTTGGIDPQGIVNQAQNLAQRTGSAEIADLYGISKSKAKSSTLYSFSETGFYVRRLEKRVASSVGPIVLNLENGDDQRLLRGALIYIPFGSSPAHDNTPDCHLMEQRDYQRDYETREATQALPRFGLIPGKLVETHAEADVVHDVLERLLRHNVIVAHRGDLFAQEQGGLFF